MTSALKLLGHLIAADVRRLRILLALWIFIVAVSAVLDGVRPAAAAVPALRDMLSLAGELVWLTELVTTLVLVALVIQTHPAVGSTAFWMTRPVPPRLLAASKIILLLVIMVIAPALAEGALVLAHGFAGEVAASIAAQVLYQQSFWIATLMIAAALTPNLTKFFLVCAAVLGAAAIALTTAATIMFARLETSPPVSGSATESDPTASVVFGAFFIASALLLLVVQYRTRNRLRSVLAGAAGLALALAITSNWQWPILLPTGQLPSWAGDRSTVRLEVRPETIATETMPMPLNDRPTAGWSLVRGQVQVTPLEPGWSADLTLVDGSLDLGGAGSIVSRGGARSPAIPFTGGEEYSSRAALRHVLGVTRLSDGVPPRNEAPVLFLASRPDVERHAPAAGHYRGRFEVTLTKYDVEAALPLHPGARHQSRVYGVAIDRAWLSRSEIAIMIRESRVISMWDREPQSIYTYYLRNRRLAEALDGREVYARTDSSLLRLLPGDFSVGREHGFWARAMTLSFPPRYAGLRSETLSLDDRWLADAELVVVRARPEGVVDRTVEVRSFPLGNPQSALAPGAP